ncbi:unnamed protein product [Dracunculus medinensis]|uniref:Mediator of RNA polymerase II transcription subunit 9 n=1 Tax=Dracunculus medinensis TaxID=318479 RepID=A0A0N4UCI6_DRAME|nr:unnamed protein product [Dracunculus medinensis]
MNEECIIRKLIADGDGGGDDRRFASLLPLIIRMIKDPESTSSLLPKVLKMLDAAETAIQRQLMIGSMNEKQVESYKELASQIEAQILEANEKIQLTKKQLVLAKGIRKNKEEYELLAKMIEKIPSRHETTM